MKIIMYLEDNAYLKNHTVNILNEQSDISTDYKVIGFHRIDQANDFIDKYSEDICCIITDLNMDDRWLDNHKQETNGALFSGWIWLKYNVFDALPDVPIIIYSGYIDDLKEHLYNKAEMTEIEKRHIQLINKGGNRNQGLQGLYNAIKKALSL